MKIHKMLGILLLPFLLLTFVSFAAFAGTTVSKDKVAVTKGGLSKLSSALGGVKVKTKPTVPPKYPERYWDYKGKIKTIDHEKKTITVGTVKFGNRVYRVTPDVMVILNNQFSKLENLKPAMDVYIEVERNQVSIIKAASKVKG